MEKRLTSRDFILLGILAFLTILIMLSMYMVDRQWLKMSEMQLTLQEQASDIRSLNTNIRSITQRVQAGAGITTTKATAPASHLMSPGFKKAYAATQQPDYAEGDWLVDSFKLGLKTISAVVSTDFYASTVQSYVLESLLQLNSDTLELQAFIAKSWNISPDGLVYTFTLRDDVHFSDGVALTSADVVFTYDFILNEKIAAAAERASFQYLESVTAKGKFTVQFVFKQPYFDALYKLGLSPILAKHFYHPYLKNPLKYNQSKGLLLGSGPYRLKNPTSWKGDKGFVELVRNPRYWGAVQPSFDRVSWKIIENASAQLTTYRNGDIDSYEARPVEYKKLLKDKELNSRAQHWEYTDPFGGYYYVGWNQKKSGKSTVFADKRVRQAMTYLIDKQRLIKEILLGYGEPAISPFSPRTQQHDPAIKSRHYDLQKAKKLLKQAGYWDRDGDGIIEDSDNKPFEFKVSFGQTSVDGKRMILMLKDSFARAGIKLIPSPTEWTVLLDMLKHKTFDACFLGWSNIVETDLYGTFHSSQIKEGAQNYTSYSNPELDKLIDKARITIDKNKRMKIWQAAERIVYEDQPYTFVYRKKTLVFTDKRIKNIAINAKGLNLGGLPLVNYVPKQLQRHGL